MFKRFIFISTVIFFTTPTYSGEPSQKLCNNMYQSFIMNSILEETCNFGGNNAQMAGELTKKLCSNKLPDSVRNKLENQVTQDFKKDYNRLGKRSLCEEQRVSYNEASKFLSDALKQY